MFKQKEDTTEKLIEEKLQELPEVIRDVVVNSDWRNVLKKIIDKNNLLIDQGLAIETETLLMMIGLDDPENYTKNIKKEAGLEKDQAIKIAEEVNEKILKEMKKKIIEKSYEESGRKENKIDDLLGYREELEEILPSIRTDVVEEEDENRNQLVNELGDDIMIDDSPEEEEDVYNYKPRPALDPELIPKANEDVSRLELVDQKTEVKEEPTKEDLWKEAAKNYEPKTGLDPDLELRADKNSNRIELDGSETKNNNTIEYEPLKEEGPLPDLTPLRTLERDTDTLKGRPHRKSDVLEKLDDTVLIKEVEGVDKKDVEKAPEGEIKENEVVAPTPTPAPVSTPAPTPTPETAPEVEPIPEQKTEQVIEQKNSDLPPGNIIEDNLMVESPVSEPPQQTQEPVFAPENLPTEDVTQQTTEGDLVVRPKSLEPKETLLSEQKLEEPQSPGSDPYREPIE